MKSYCVITQHEFLTLTTAKHRAIEKVHIRWVSQERRVRICTLNMSVIVLDTLLGWQRWLQTDRGRLLHRQQLWLYQSSSQGIPCTWRGRIERGIPCCSQLQHPYPDLAIDSPALLRLYLLKKTVTRTSTLILMKIWHSDQSVSYNVTI